MKKQTDYKIKKINRKFIYVIYFFLYIALIIDIELKERFIIHDDLLQTLINIAFLLSPILALLYRANFFKDYLEQKIILKDKQLYIPKDFGKLSYKNYHYEDIISIDKRGKKLNTFICIQTKDKVYHLYRNLFKNQNDFSIFYYSLLNKIKENSDYQSIKSQRLISKTIFSKIQIGSTFLTLLLITTFSLQVLTKSSDIHYFISIGAANRDLIINGDYFRLITSFFLHANYPHFIFNILIFFPFFYLLESLIGYFKTYIILFIGHAIGLTMSLLFNDHIILGASAGIFSLIGAYCIICFKYKNLLPAGLYLPLKKWLFFLAFNLLLLFTLKNISFSAHFFGFLTGFTLMLIFSHKNTFLSLKKRNKNVMVISFIVIISLQFILLFSYTSYLENKEYRELVNFEVLKKLVNDENNIIVNNLNMLAWQIAIDENANDRLQSIGKLAIERSSIINIVNPKIPFVYNF